MRSVKCGVCSAECEVRSEVWCVRCEVWSLKCEVWSVESGVRSNTGKCLLQAVQYKVVLGSALCKICSTKFYWESLCAIFAV